MRRGKVCGGLAEGKVAKVRAQWVSSQSVLGGKVEGEVRGGEKGDGEG